MIKYSVIVPHYNDSATIDTLLRSIPERSDIEVIICDDNSRTDEFESLLTITNKYRHTNVIQNTRQNKGAGAARNCALDLATGEYLLFADADDYFVDSAFDHFDTHSKDDAEVIYFSPSSIKIASSEPSIRHQRYAQLVRKHTPNSRDIRYKFHVPWSKLILRGLVQHNNIEFDEVLVSNDIMFSTKIGLLAKKILVSPTEVYCVTEGVDRLTSPSKIKQKIRFRVELNYIAYCSQYGDLLKLPSVTNLLRRHWHCIDICSAIQLWSLIWNRQVNILPQKKTLIA